MIDTRVERPPVAHREYFIYGETIAVGDGSFRARGFIRRPSPTGTGLPFETRFKPEETYLNEEVAYDSGVVFAKKLIDGFWKAVGQ
jgi:hypothetical protein